MWCMLCRYVRKVIQPSQFDFFFAYPNTHNQISSFQKLQAKTFHGLSISLYNLPIFSLKMAQSKQKGITKQFTPVTGHAQSCFTSPTRKKKSRLKVRQFFFKHETVSVSFPRIKKNKKCFLLRSHWTIKNNVYIKWTQSTMIKHRVSIENSHKCLTNIFKFQKRNYSQWDLQTKETCKLKTKRRKPVFQFFPGEGIIMFKNLQTFQAQIDWGKLTKK